MNTNPVSIRTQLFGQRNRDQINNIIRRDVQQRAGISLSPKQLDRLERTVDYYVEAVYEEEGDKPVNALNSEIIRYAAKDFNTYLQRNEVQKAAPQPAVATVMNEQLFRDTSKRFEELQNERRDVLALPPSVPDFRIPLEEDGPTMSELYEKAKMTREGGMSQFVNANDSFLNSQIATNRLNEMQLVERRMQTANAASTHVAPLIVPPDRRELMLPANLSINSDSMNDYRLSESTRALGQANANPTIVQPTLRNNFENKSQVSTIIRENDVVNYKEIESNLFLYSADRDWLKNTYSNRYSFSINFDTMYSQQGFKPNPTVQQKFKNITRIEFVKAILPAESLEILPIQQTTCDSSSIVTTFQTNVLSYPFITLQVSELETQNYGTNNFIDRAFSVLQYDANWQSDDTCPSANGTGPKVPGYVDSKGYLAMIPKFMKTQKVYHPNPLSTLQKLTIDLRRPDGSPLSSVPDTIDIDDIIAGTNTFLSSSVWCTPSGIPYYYFIKTDSFFSRFMLSVGDRIQIAGYKYVDDGTYSADTIKTLNEFTQFINRPEGHLVVALGNDSNGGVYDDNPNIMGYADYIVIPAYFRQADLVLGNTTPYDFAPTSNIDTVLTTTGLTFEKPRRLINLNRQVQLVFRVITRDMDGVAQIRSDNI
jgi:hypothetical protein